MPTLTDDNASMHIVTRELPIPAITTNNLEHISECLESCSGHKFCPYPGTPALLPTRLIDCSNPDSPRLVTTATLASESLDGTGIYAALSYVWGERQPNRTTAQNIKRYHTLIEPHLIPQTIQDGITVTHNLGVKYLWVDSFCILQDSDEDKGHEIERIRIYFHNAYITIVAANAGRVSEGFLYEVPPRRIPSFKLPYPIDASTVGTMSLAKLDDDIDEFDDAVDERAWCLEERILSPRRLIFRAHALQYECYTLSANINGSSLGLQGEEFHDGYLHLPHPEEAPDIDPLKLWLDIVKEYTSRRLTKKKDKLVALAGIAEHFELVWREMNLQTRYVAGLWTHHFPYTLLWIVSEPQSLPEVSRGPSWSWAAVNSLVDVPFNSFRSCQTMCSVERCETTLTRSTNPYGEANTGFIGLHSPAAEGLMWKVGYQDKSQSNLFERSSQQPEDSLVQNSQAIGRLIPDSLEFETEREQDVPVLVVILAEDDALRFGLALVPLPVSGHYQGGIAIPQCYRRIGYVELSGTYSQVTASREWHIL